MTRMAAARDRGDTQLVIRARFSAGPLTLTTIADVPGYVVHVDVDDAGVYLSRGQAHELAGALLRCCAPTTDRGELALHGLVLHARLGARALTLTALSDVPGQVARLEVAGGRDGNGRRSSSVYLSARQAQQLAAAVADL